MRHVRVVAAIICLLAGKGNSQTTDAWRSVSFDAEAWHAIHIAVSNDTGRLSVRQDVDSNGFAFPRAAPQRRGMAAEADIRVQQRLAPRGWNFAGVTLYQDDANFWMLALIEGPDGKHSVDFIENHAGVWQAQSEPQTALTREGQISFGWKADAVYRLRLAFVDGKVRADVIDPADGRLISSAAFSLGRAKAVRTGRPGVIARASSAVCERFRFAVRQASAGLADAALADGTLGRLALLDDATLPGHDRAANARLAAALANKGFGVTRLTAQQFLNADLLSCDVFPVAVIPQCASLPAHARDAVAQFAREGGQTIVIGGPFLDNALWLVGGAWLDAAGREKLLSCVAPRHRPFVIGPQLDLGAWRRSCSDKSEHSTFSVVNEGQQKQPCLRLDIASLSGWDIRHTPLMPALFGAGDDFFTFMAKGSDAVSQIAVEISERDGSRWIATAELTSEWRRIGLPREAFRFWPDSSAKRRGELGGHFDPSQAQCVGFGMSASHTPAMLGRGHTVWIADVGTACDPLAAAGVAAVDSGISIESVYPRYKVFQLSGPIDVFQKTASLCTNVVCAIPRTLGEGYNRGGKWRFVTLAQATERATGTSGACEWLLLNTRFPLRGTATAGFGYTDPAVWSSRDVAGRIADTAERMVRGALFESAGAEQFAYWPGEPVRLGAQVWAFGQDKPEGSITLDVLDGSRVLWSKRVTLALEPGVNGCTFVWQPPAAPGAYTVRARLEVAGVSDEIQHSLEVLDPAPDAKRAFITARDGDFWLEGKKWYPVGVNYWPLYVSGMDQTDYWPGWMRGAYYSPSLVERDLVHMANMGINQVSIQSPPPAEYRNLLHFIRLCKKRGVYVNLFVGQASPLAYDGPELKSFLETARIPGNATVFAYDTIWEPGNYIFKDDSARAKWDAEWRAWIDERYGSLENAEKDWGFKARLGKDGKVISPPDGYFREDGAWRGMMAAYRRFMDNLTSQLWGRANRKLRELDPNHLISFRQGNTLPHDFALSGPVKHIDFICPEGYAIRDTEAGEDAIGFITRYADFTTHGKPIVWSEFGQSVWDNVRMAPSPAAVIKQGAYSERFYRTALNAGANGTVPWWWVGGYRVDERSDFGIISPDRTERPSARLIRDYGPRFRAPHAKPQPTSWFEFDRDAHAGGYCQAAFHEGAAAYHAAIKGGQVLGVRTAGTGRDSETVPPVAVGNVPCNGSNPPKYLDAEFNFLQIRDADGVWREAEDGAAITVAAGQSLRVRASLGNTQEATWRSPAGVQLVVRAADGKVVGTAPLAADVPYLCDGAFGEFDVLPQINHSLVLTARLESSGHLCTPFGESRVFTVRAR